MATVFLVRHAQASFGKEDYDALSPLGFTQSRLLGEALRARAVRPDVVVAGTLKRHHQTAQACLSAMGCSVPVETRAAFDELDHAELVARQEPRYADLAVLGADLRTRPDPHRWFQGLFVEALERWLSGHHDAEYREPWPAFRARCIAALDTLALSLPPEATAMVFTSGGPISAAMQGLLALSDEGMLRLFWGIANATVSKVVVDEGTPRLASWNEHGHLEGNGGGLLTYR